MRVRLLSALLSTWTLTSSAAAAEDEDCNSNGVEDWIEIREGSVPDCNGNEVPDSCDIAAGTSQDEDSNAVPDCCEGDPRGCRFRLSFVQAEGEPYPRDGIRVLARLEIERKQDFIQGWTLLVGSEGCRIVDATVEGTRAEDQADGGEGCYFVSGFTFERTLVTTVAETGEVVATSSIVMSCYPGAAASPHDLLSITAVAESDGDGPCRPCTFFYILQGRIVMLNGKVYPIPVMTRLTSDGQLAPFAARSVMFEVCHRTDFRRGDANNDGAVDISDAIFSFGSLFLGGPLPDCPDAADSNDDGRIDISDPITTLRAIFKGTSTIPWPGPAACGHDPTEDGLGCNRSVCEPR